MVEPVKDPNALLCVGGPAHGQWVVPHLPDGGARWHEENSGYRYNHVYKPTSFGGIPALIHVAYQVLGEAR